jgi:hypothetical protein
MWGVRDNNLRFFYAIGALRCRNEQYLDDDIIRAMFALFNEYYGSRGEYIFIPPTHIMLWLSVLASGSANPDPWLVRAEAVSSPNLKKAFLVISKPGHFGALEVDFAKNTISTGDSLGMSFRPEIILCVEKWIEVCTNISRTWTRKIGQFDVPRQPPESGSCAVNSLNAIEYSINPKVGCWSHERSAYYRTRILKLVTGFITLGTESYPQFPAESRSKPTNSSSSMLPTVARTAARIKANRTVGNAAGMELIKNNPPMKITTRAMTATNRKGRSFKMADTAVDAINILNESSNGNLTDTDAPSDRLTKTASTTISNATEFISNTIAFAADEAQPIDMPTNTSATTYKFIPRATKVTTIKNPFGAIDTISNNTTATSLATNTLTGMTIDTSYKAMTDTSLKETSHTGKTCQLRHCAVDFFDDIEKQVPFKRRRSASDASSSESEYDTAPEFEVDRTKNPIIASEGSRKICRVQERTLSAASDTLETLPLSSSNDNISLSHQESSPGSLDADSWEPTFHCTFSDCTEAENNITRWAIRKGYQVVKTTAKHGRKKEGKDLITVRTQ